MRSGLRYKRQIAFRCSAPSPPPPAKPLANTRVVSRLTQGGNLPVSPTRREPGRKLTGPTDDVKQSLVADHSNGLSRASDASGSTLAWIASPARTGPLS